MSASLPSWARKGVKVVCVDASPSEWDGYAPLTENAVYTILRVEPVALHVTRGQMPGLRLVEVGMPGRCFNVNRFRPLVSTKTEAEDVAHFTHHLRQPVRESERA